MLGLLINIFTTGSIITMICNGKYKEAAFYYALVILFCVLAFISTITSKKDMRDKWRTNPWRVAKIVLLFSLFWPYYFLEAAYTESVK